MARTRTIDLPRTPMEGIEALFLGDAGVFAGAFEGDAAGDVAEAVVKRATRISTF